MHSLTHSSVPQIATEVFATSSLKDTNLKEIRTLTARSLLVVRKLINLPEKGTRGDVSWRVLFLPTQVQRLQVWAVHGAHLPPSPDDH